MKLKILNKKIIATNTWQVWFDLCGNDFNFIAGQYIQLTIPKLKYADDKGFSRIFSLACSPNKKNEICVAFRYTGSGFKKTLIEMKVGGKATAKGPWGSFNLISETNYPVVFIAGGIGITPFISMIKFAYENKTKHNIKLLYFNKDISNAAFKPDLDEIEKNNKNFSYIDRFKRIDKQFISKNVPEIKNSNWYIAGPEAMVISSQKIIEDLGVSRKKIKIEQFAGY